MTNEEARALQFGDAVATLDGKIGKFIEVNPPLLMAMKPNGEHAGWFIADCVAGDTRADP
jgi:hypothetical protein